MRNSFICKVSLPPQISGKLNRSRSHSRSISPLNTTNSNPNLTYRHNHNMTTTIAGTDCEKYCMFTCQEQSSVVIASQKPIASKLIESLLTQESDIEYVCKTALNNVDLFQFDRAYGVKDSTLKMYAEFVKPYTHNLLSGKKGLIVLFGPSDCGKSTILREKSDDKGILPKIIEDIFKLAELSKQSKRDTCYDVTLSALSIFEERVVDLLEVTNKQVEVKKDEEGNWCVEKCKEKLLKNANDLYSILQHVTKIRKMEERIEGEDGFNKTHLIIQINVGKYVKGKLIEEGLLQIVEVCGSEQASGTSKYQKAVARSFNYLSDAIYNSGVGKIYPYISKTSLTKVLSPTLCPYIPILLVSCISPKPSHYMHCLPAIKYAISIKECVKKELLSSPHIPERCESSQLDLLEKELLSNGYQNAEKKVFDNWYNTKRQELNNCLKKYKSLYNDSENSEREELLAKIDSTNKLLEMLEEYKNNHQSKPESESSKPATTERKVEDLEKKLSKLETSMHQIGQLSTEKEKEKEKNNLTATYEYKPANGYKHEDISMNPTIRFQPYPNANKSEDQTRELQNEMLLLHEELKEKNKLIQRYENTINDQRQSYEQHITEIKEGLSKTMINCDEKDKSFSKLNEEMKTITSEQKAQIISLKNECNALNEDKKELETKIALLSEHKSEIVKTNDLYVKREAELENSKATLTDNIKKLTKENDGIKQELMGSQNDTKIAMQQLEATKNKLKAIEEALLLEKAKTEELKHGNEELKLNLKKSHQDQENYKKDSLNNIKSLEDKLQAFSDVKNHMSNSITEANAKEAELTNTNIELSNSLKKTSSELDILKKEYAQSINEKKSVEQRLISAESKCETLQREKMQTETMLLQLKNQVLNTENKLAEYEKNKAIFETSKQEEIDTQTQKILNLEIKVAGLQEEIDIHNQGKMQLENELREYKAEVDRLNDQLKEYEQINETSAQKYAINIEALNTEIQSRMADNTKLKESCESLKLVKEKSERLNQNLKEECEEMAKVNKTLKKQIKELERALNGYSEEREQDIKENKRRENEKEKDEIKTKMLGEIHGMIKQFRDERSKKQTKLYK